MLKTMRSISAAALAAAFAVATGALAADAPAGLDQFGKPDLKSAGALAFGPEGILFVGDAQGAALFAIQTPAAKVQAAAPFKVEGVDAKAAALLGAASTDLLINDLAVQPGTNVVYLSVSRGKGPAAEPALITIDPAGKAALVSLDKVHYAKTAISNAPAADAKDRRGNSVRQEAITDIAFVDGRVILAGLSNEEFASKLRAFRFPFGKADQDTSVEIYHGAHGALETRAPVRTFVPLVVDGQPQILAAYTCTPLVRFAVSELQPGAKVRGTTVAELGNRNRPLDIIAYEKGGKSFLLLANSARGVMKVATDDLAKQDGITTKVDGTAGLGYETIAALQGVEHLDKVGADHVALLVKTPAGLTLEAIPLP